MENLKFIKMGCIKEFSYMPGEQIGKIEDIKIMNGADIYVVDSQSSYLYFFKLDPNKNRAHFKKRFNFGFSITGSQP